MSKTVKRDTAERDTAERDTAERDTAERDTVQVGAERSKRAESGVSSQMSAQNGQSEPESACQSSKSTEDQGFRLDEVGDHKVKTEGQDRRLKEVGDHKVIDGSHEEGSLEVSPGCSEGGDLAGLHSNCSESTDLYTLPRYTASEEAFNNSVLMQGRVVPPSVLSILSKEDGPSDDAACRAGQPPDLKLRSAGSGEFGSVVSRCRESPGSATNLAKEKCSRYGTRIQDHKVADEQMLVGQGPRKRLVRQDQAALGDDQVRSALRLRTDGGLAGRRSAVPEWAHGTVPASQSPCVFRHGTIRRSSDSGCTVLGTLSLRQQRQAAETSVRRAHQVEGYIRPKNNGLIALLNVASQHTWKGRPFLRSTSSRVRQRWQQ